MLRLDLSLYTSIYNPVVLLCCYNLDVSDSLFENIC